MRLHSGRPLSVRLRAALTDLVSAWRELAPYLGLGPRAHRGPIRSTGDLADFIDSRASHVTQAALYGYLKTRSGMRFPVLFDDDEFVRSINIAKWQIWLACVSDLAVYAGGLLRQRTTGGADVGEIVNRTVDLVLTNNGLPADAGPEFAKESDSLRARVQHAVWSAVGDDETAFSESPGALVKWAPVIDELKQLDAEIVENSVRFRWIEVRRALRRRLDADALTGLHRRNEPAV